MNIGDKIKVLVLSSDFGDGHQQAANAIFEANKLYRRTEAEVIVTDFMEWTHPRLHSLSRYLYIQSVRKFPSLYGYLFHKTRRPNSWSDALKKLKLFGLSRVMRLIQEVRPTIIVSTFPIAAAAMSILKANGLISIPTVTVITDHTDHSYWIHPHTDTYIVGSDRVREALIGLGIGESRIAVTGIPVRPHFCRSYDRSSLFAKYGLNSSLPTVLVMGGGFGMISEGLIELLNSDALNEQMQFIIVCGRNRKLQNHLLDELAHSRHHLMITGYVDHIHELMAVSDLIITKPGGLTTSEAVALELPMLLYKPLPGQEQDNAAFLLQSGVALLADNDADLIFKLTEVLRRRDILEAMRLNARELGMKHAAFKVLDTIMLARGPLTYHVINA
ncbi:MGDG synthase family glycosyltransferase [Ferviditalea candida]|uniref:Glycosyltransferase n=1 Tax=Ferviditalea candida TaxID=3108399 RepID=A0ABU5ZIF1_9BACL|nr:glycosyltransferase [Paenibacillaceae bacterium T2]